MSKDRRDPQWLKQREQMVAFLLGADIARDYLIKQGDEIEFWYDECLSMANDFLAWESQRTEELELTPALDLWWKEVSPALMEELKGTDTD